MGKSNLSGVISAVVTPLTNDDHPSQKNLQLHIRTLVREGVDGILLLGTTGEGPSMSMTEREEVISAGLEAANGSFVLAGTGFASLRDTISATQKAFELGVDGVVVLPPYYYKDIPTPGLEHYFKQVFDDSVPDDRQMFLYEIPQVTKVPLPFDLFESLIVYARHKFGGIKDSTGDLSHAIELMCNFPELKIFVGTDKLLLEGLKNGASGCITAGSNVLAPLAVDVYRKFLEEKDANEMQADLSAAREIVETFPPFPPTLKSLLALRYETPGWNVRYPLLPLSTEKRNRLLASLKGLDLRNKLEWLYL